MVADRRRGCGVEQGSRGWRAVSTRAASIVAAAVALGMLGVGAAVAWQAFRPATPFPRLSAVASRGLVWQSQLGVAGDTPRAPGLVQSGSQAANFAKYLTARARGIPGLTMLSSSLMSVSVVRAAWTAAGGYEEFRVVDRRWFSVGTAGAQVSQSTRGLVTIYVREVRPGSLRVTGLAYLPAIVSPGSRRAPSLYPDYFTSDGNNPLGG